ARAGLADEVREALGPGVVDVRIEQPQERKRIAAARRNGRSPRQLFADYLQERSVDDPRLGAAFAQLHDELSGADREPEVPPEPAAPVATAPPQPAAEPPVAAEPVAAAQPEPEPVAAEPSPAPAAAEPEPESEAGPSVDGKADECGEVDGDEVDEETSAADGPQQLRIGL
ncbi:MAG: hypothetical protein AAGD35_23405, partial [Actinomycetota bacterium]